MQNRFGTTGIIIAFIAITIAIFQNNFRPEMEHSTLDSPPKSISVKIFEKSFDLLLGRKTQSPEKNQQAFDTVSYTYMGLGLLALLFGIVSFLKKEHIRYSAVAAGLGIVAIGWEFIILALGLAILMAIIIAVLSNT